VNEKIIFIGVVFALLVTFGAGCTTNRPAVIEPVDYIKPPTVEAAQFGIDERIASLERALGESRSLNERARAEISGIRESCEAIINAGRRSGDLIQETLEQAEALDRWVNWAYSRLQYLESVLASQVQNTDMVAP
jgi:hypothetical protein